MTIRGNAHLDRIDAALTPLLDERDDLDKEVAALKAKLAQEALNYSARIEQMNSALAQMREENAAQAARIDQIEGELAISRLEGAKDLRDLNALRAKLVSVKDSLGKVLEFDIDVAAAEKNLEQVETEINMLGHNKGPRLVEMSPLEVNIPTTPPVIKRL